jgi:hypothetical protein
VDCADRISMLMDDKERERLVWPPGAPLIVCPSHGRAANVKVLRLIPDIPLCVAESQEPLYREHHPDAEYIVHPDELIGIAPKRQWLLDRYGDVFMLDDDVTKMQDLSQAPGEQMSVTDPDKVRSIIYRLFDQAEQMGAFLVGFNNFAHPAAYRPQRPFGLTGGIAGRAIGLRTGSKLFFPQNALLMTDDVYVSALNAYFHRYCLRDERYCLSAPGCWGNEGGMAVHRTWARMIENNELLVRMFGPDVIVKKTGTAIAGLSHDAQIALKIPW